MVCYTRLGCGEEVDGPSMAMLPLSLVFNKTRLVLAANRCLNFYVKESTKLDTLDELSGLLKPGMWFSVDDVELGIASAVRGFTQIFTPFKMYICL